MTAVPSRRSVRTFRVVATVSAALPLCLTACAPVASVVPQATELQAAAGSDLLEVSTERVYEAVETRLLTDAGGGGLSALIGETLSTSGYIVLFDGMITEAKLQLRAVGLPEAAFELTEPTALRRDMSENATVSAVGTLSTRGVVRPHTTLRVTPTLLTEEFAEFDVRLSVPDNPLLAQDSFFTDELAAHVVFAAH
ncbi:hypothetical protein [Leucobacter chironomi]|uniref:hypothetical protein n=1 Tax=Leucobacter chironomi TaxID=491918 RepID=UPI00040EE3D4|nr:hypothetical protein [Leucobacter chironomi]